MTAWIVIAVAIEALLLVTWLVERVARRWGIDIGCPSSCRCHGGR